MAEYKHDEEEENKPKKGEAPAGTLKDFDCPTCSANNPVDEGFGNGSEVRCYYCGAEFEVKLGEGSKPKFREL